MTYPIMARKHEMVSSLSLIPEGVFGGDDSDIIRYKNREWYFLKSTIHFVHEFNQQNNAKWHEENVSRMRITGSEPRVRTIYLVYEPSFSRIYTFARSVVKYRRFPFFVYVDLESLLHLHITPEYIYYIFI